MLQIQHVSEGFAVSFTACVPLVLKFTLQIADVLYCIFMPILTRKTFATSFYGTGMVQHDIAVGGVANAMRAVFLTWFLPPVLTGR